MKREQKKLGRIILVVESPCILQQQLVTQNCCCWLPPGGQVGTLHVCAWCYELCAIRVRVSVCVSVCVCACVCVCVCEKDGRPPLSATAHAGRWHFRFRLQRQDAVGKLIVGNFQRHLSYSGTENKSGNTGLMHWQCKQCA